VPGGAKALKILTPNARAIITRGKAIVLFSKQDETTQLVNIQFESSLENRFEPNRKIPISAGEMTALDFGSLSVVPLPPRAIALADLKTKLSYFNLSDSDRVTTLESAQNRKDRKFASLLVQHGQKKKPFARVSPVDYKNKELEKAKVYIRHKSFENDEDIQRVWARKVVGGSSEGEQMMFPQQAIAHRKHVQILVRDPAALKVKKYQTDLEDEKLNDIPVDEVINRLRSFPLEKFDCIFTHGKNGEYGHKRHIDVHEAVTQMLNQRLLSSKKLCLFSYTKGRDICKANPHSDKFIKLKEKYFKRKKFLIREVYGFEENSFEDVCCSDTESFMIEEMT